MGLGNLVGGFVIITVGVSLFPSVAESVARVDQSWNGTDWVSNASVSSTVATITGLTTIFFALGIMAAGIAIAVRGLKEAGAF